MDIAKEEVLRQEFRDILFFLAESQETFRDKTERIKIYKRLEGLYHSSSEEEKFRHFYSDIFTVLTTIKQGDRVGSIDILGQNLSVIRKGYQAVNIDENGNPIDISYAIRKLYDHVSLDIARMGYSDAADRMLSQEANIAEIQTQINAAAVKTESIHQRLDLQEQDLKSAQKEYIAILGIFASVVLTFTAGIAFSTSVLQNFHTASIYRITGTILLIGIVLTNALYGLFYYVDRLINKPDKRKITPIVITNVILIILLIATVIGWYCGIAETRNIRIEESVVENITEQDISTSKEANLDESVQLIPDDMDVESIDTASSPVSEK